MRRSMLTQDQRRAAADDLRAAVIKGGPGTGIKEAANKIHMDYNLACTLAKQFKIKPLPSIQKEFKNLAEKMEKSGEPLIVITNSDFVDSLMKPMKGKEKMEEETKTKIEANEETKPEVTEERKRKHRAFMTPEIKEAIASDFKAGVSAKEICKKYDVSYSTAMRNVPQEEQTSQEEDNMGRKNKNARGRGRKNTRSFTSQVKNNAAAIKEFEEKSIVDEAPEVSMEELEKMCSEKITPATYDYESDFFKYFGVNEFSKYLSQPSYKEAVEAGLIADRHNIPVKEFVFDEIKNDLMFDYASQEKICNEFIDNHFKFDAEGKANKKLVLYVTGLQCALGSIFKCTSERGIELILKHYNSDDRKYYSQTISGDGVITKNNFESLDNYGMGIHFYKCNPMQFEEDTMDIYSIKIVNYTKDFNVDSLESSAAIITDNYDKIWEIYPTILKSINANRDTKLGAFVYDSKINGGKFFWGSNISKGYNK